MRSQPAQGLYHTVYIINNLYEPPSWLKHVGNVLLLQEPQTPNPKTLVACFQSVFNCITKLKKKKKRAIKPLRPLRLLLLKKSQLNGGCKLGNLQNEAWQELLCKNACSQFVVIYIVGIGDRQVFLKQLQ